MTNFYSRSERNDDGSNVLEEMAMLCLQEGEERESIGVDEGRHMKSN